MENYGLANVWLQGDIVTRFLIVFLLGMSSASWIVMIVKAIANRRLTRTGLHVQKDFWAARSIEAGIEAIGADNPYSNIATAAIEAHEQKDQPLLEGRTSNTDWLAYCVRNELDEQIAHLQGGLAVLASIASTAPFIGLFGTVWGIYHALIAIGASGQASLDHVAGPVGESLVMTAIGLFVAIPAVLGYNYVARGNRGVAQKLMRFSHQLQVYYVTGNKIKEAQAAKGVAYPARTPITSTGA
ncbi:biopolymer transporter [Herbaspirillum rubrisubalbicans]|jgi:biopolymer transport protein ExbB|uniref:Biopolymer transport protein ExbB n=2 Tax=Herbaspirillum rubrisubalbicans TaxID=80842 RepID=A0ABX9BZR2_9BURK|nr:MotA/TolQ/ExbB proton channel family protein [Herbaspirillum rubrisubalbicans]MCP1574848.1 biopolymer transport protein ExbB [Herbaspirillum rubrisubalbicans]NQE51319.1 biopolymer transporter [Herbaspirillum rubrisubalbicans]QJQ03319.1 MotA/TolQ/ExbB proton channel family protein [Herbaspirillum rubrisubalbicans Os34]RAM63549.1 biopolymer transporter [Herbaspirillum rubrisubalbicans]RAN48661.1 biopolymer transporter [Herbaspirillum rubrisubalbicans]